MSWLYRRKNSKEPSIEEELVDYLPKHRESQDGAISLIHTPSQESSQSKKRHQRFGRGLAAADHRATIWPKSSKSRTPTPSFEVLEKWDDDSSQDRSFCGSSVVRYGPRRVLGPSYHDDDSAMISSLDTLFEQLPSAVKRDGLWYFTSKVTGQDRERLLTYTKTVDAFILDHSLDVPASTLLRLLSLHPSEKPFFSRMHTLKMVNPRELTIFPFLLTPTIQKLTLSNIPYGQQRELSSFLDALAALSPDLFELTLMGRFDYDVVSCLPQFGKLESLDLVDVFKDIEDLEDCLVDLRGSSLLQRLSVGASGIEMPPSKEAEGKRPAEPPDGQEPDFFVTDLHLSGSDAFLESILNTFKLPPLTHLSLELAVGDGTFSKSKDIDVQSSFFTSYIQRFLSQSSSRPKVPASPRAGYHAKAPPKAPKYTLSIALTSGESHCEGLNLPEELSTSILSHRFLHQIHIKDWRISGLDNLFANRLCTTNNNKNLYELDIDSNRSDPISLKTLERLGQIYPSLEILRCPVDAAPVDPPPPNSTTTHPLRILGTKEQSMDGKRVSDVIIVARCLAGLFPKLKVFEILKEEGSEPGRWQAINDILNFKPLD